jgi:hypothetical protein
MTSLTIEIPKSEIAIISDFIKKRGGNILNIDLDNDLTEAEFALLQETYREALLIRSGVIKPVPVSELWND